MNSFGRIFRISIYGESHGQELGVLIDGVPAGISLSQKDFEQAIERRKSKLPGTSTRKESDIPLIKSGVYNSFTSAAPILISFENKNFNSQDYNFDGFYRPGHSDFVANKKYKSFNDYRGGGHFSGRLTLALVAAGVVAAKIIPEIKISASVISVGGSKDFQTKIDEAIQNKDSLGAVIECKINNLPLGFGEPFFDSFESVLSHLIFSIPGAKAIEFGNGIFAGSANGSEFNDVFINQEGKTKTNNSGGINGGISNGNEVVFRVYFRPSASISKSQKTFNFESKKMADFEIKGRHDVCYALRVPVVVESVVAIALADFKLILASKEI
ncbi:MAG: chorismate synthase [Bacteroidales bacterium]|nr:chorismate synthase [Bacteroidales bacterium]